MHLLEDALTNLLRSLRYQDIEADIPLQSKIRPPNPRMSPSSRESERYDPVVQTNLRDRIHTFIAYFFPIFGGVPAWKQRWSPRRGAATL